MNNSDAILQADKVSFSYGGAAVLQNVSVALKEGEVLGIIGESGSGKTSLARLLAGMLTPDSGRLSYRGEKIKGPDETLVPGHEKIKLVKQDFDLMPFVSVDENMMRQTLSLSDSVQKRLLGHLRSKLKLSKVSKNRAADTSGGQKQRVALATALASRPEILILDEPFSNLDYPLKQELIQLLQTDWKAKAMVVITHEPADMLAMADRVLVLQKGKKVQEGSPEEIYHRPKNEYVARLLGPVNVLNSEQAAAFDLTAEKGVLLRPVDFKIGKDGLRAKVLAVQYMGTEYQLRVFCEAIAAELILHSAEAKSGEIFVQL